MDKQNETTTGLPEGGREVQRIEVDDQRFLCDQRGELMLSEAEIDALTGEWQQALLLRHGTEWYLNHRTAALLRRRVGEFINEVDGGLYEPPPSPSTMLLEAVQVHRRYVGHQQLLAEGVPYYVRGFDSKTTEAELRTRLEAEAFVLDLYLPRAQGTPYARVVLERRSAAALVARLETVQLKLRGQALRFAPAPPRRRRAG
jgi:hypothetical protein